MEDEGRAKLARKLLMEKIAAKMQTAQRALKLDRAVLEEIRSEVSDFGRHFRRLKAVALEGASRLADDHDLLVEDERRRADVARLEARAARDKADERAAAAATAEEAERAARVDLEAAARSLASAEAALAENAEDRARLASARDLAVDRCEAAAREGVDERRRLQEDLEAARRLATEQVRAARAETDAERRQAADALRRSEAAREAALAEARKTRGAVDDVRRRADEADAAREQANDDWRAVLLQKEQELAAAKRSLEEQVRSCETVTRLAASEVDARAASEAAGAALTALLDASREHAAEVGAELASSRSALEKSADAELRASRHAVAAARDKADDALARLAKAEADLRAVRAKAENDGRELAEAWTTARLEHEAELRRLRADRDGAAANLADERDALKSERDALQSERDALASDRDAWKRQCDGLRDGLRLEASLRGREADEMTRELADLKAELARAAAAPPPPDAGALAKAQADVLALQAHVHAQAEERVTLLARIDGLERASPRSQPAAPLADANKLPDIRHSQTDDDAHEWKYIQNSKKRGSQRRRSSRR